MNSGTSITDTPCPQAKWNAYNKKAQKVKGFLNSLNVTHIGWGLMGFDPEKFCLYTRSKYFNLSAFQWAATLTDKKATFPNTQEGFTLLIRKVEKLKIHISKFSPVNAEDCPEDVQKLLNTLIKIQLVITGVANFGLTRLCENYRSRDKPKNADSLLALGTSAFNMLSLMRNALAEKLIPYIPDLAVDIELEQYSLSAKSILKHRNSNCENLIQTHCHPNDGTIIPRAIIHDCIRDVKKKEKPAIKESLRIAANFIHLPAAAKKIPTQNGETYWIPRRPITNKDGTVSFEDGVIGTCERDESERTEGISNPYYRIDPETKHPIISCGVIDTPDKADQLIAIICEVVELLDSNVNGRWHIHGLYSHIQEEKLIQDVHRLIPYIEERLKEKLQKKELSLSQINTVFNDASNLLASEDSKSLNTINIDSLAQFIIYALEDVTQLLKQSEGKLKKDLYQSIFFTRRNMSTESPLSMETNPSDPSLYVFTDIIGLAQEIKNLKKTIDQYSADSQWKQSNLFDSPIGTPEMGRKLQTHSPSTSVKDQHSYQEKEENTISKPQNQIQNLKNEIKRPQSDILKATEMVVEKEVEGKGKIVTMAYQTQPSVELPTQLKDLKELLTQRQAELLAKLKIFTKHIKTPISRLESLLRDQKDTYLEKALLILKALERVLAIQLKNDKFPPLSRCAEVELLLLFYRLLGIKPILICKSGLDRSGAVRASADTQSFFEREWFKEKFQIKDVDEEDSSCEFRARLAAHHQMFNLIVHLDTCQEELFKLTNCIKGQFDLIKDLTLVVKDKNLQIGNIRDQLLKEIEKKYPSDSNQVQLLKNALYYMERYVTQLLGTEMLKTIYSTGCAGLKWQQDVSWLASQIIANPHPLKRLPPFIFTSGGDVIQLLEYTEAGRFISSSMTITRAGKFLLLRLSQLRGK